MTLHMLPDLRRARAFERLVVAAESDAEVAELLSSDEGQWWFLEARMVAQAPALRRVAEVIAARFPTTVDGVLAGDRADLLGMPDAHDDGGSR